MDKTRLPVEFEAGCIIWSIRRLRRYLLACPTRFHDHERLQQRIMIGETKLGFDAR